MLMHRTRLRLILCFSALCFSVLVCGHPLGNVSVNHYTKIMVGANSVEVAYVLDLAETPTFELLREWRLDAGSPRTEIQAKILEQARLWVKNLSFTAGGKP